MKAWKKGAVLGLIWGVMPFAMGRFDLPLWLGRLLAYPAFVATQIGFAFRWIYIGAPIVGLAIGALIGLVVGYILNKYVE